MGAEHQFQISDADKERFGEEATETLRHEGEGPKGPIEKRHTTDLLFVLLLVASWLVMTVIGTEATENGENPWILINGIDDLGRICGVDAGVTDTKHWYPVSLTGAGVCLEQCPKVSNTSAAIEDLICVSSLQNETERVDYINNDCDLYDLFPGACLCNFPLRSVSVVHYCIVTDTQFADLLKEATNKADKKEPLSEFISDILVMRTLVFGMGLAGSLGIAFLWAWLLHISCLAHFLVWGAVLAIGIMLSILAALMLERAQDWNEEDPPEHARHEVRGMKAVAISFFVAAILYWLVMFFMRSRISLAIRLVREAGDVIVSMPVIVLIPFAQAIALIIFLIPWTVYALWTATLGDMEVDKIKGTDIQIRKYSFDRDIVQRGWFLLFCLLWTAQVIVAMGQLVLSLSVAKWYFSENKDKVTSCAVFGALWVGLRYHLGTVAYGALLVALVELLRVYVYTLQRKAEETKNRLLVCLLKCAQCVLWCFERCLKFLNRNAYIQTAIFGYSFCKAARTAFFLIARNILRVGAMHGVSHYVMGIGRVFVTVLTGLIVYGVLDRYHDRDVNSFVGPTLVSMGLAMFVATMFVQIYSQTVEVLLFCFIADLELHDGHAAFAKDSLRDWVDKFGAPAPKQPNNAGEGGGADEELQSPVDKEGLEPMAIEK